jgi:O-antigen ligase
LTNIALALLLAESLVRLQGRAGSWPVANWVLGVVLALTLFSFYAEGVRNGIGVALVMFICWAVLSLSSSPRRQGKKWMYRAAVAFLGTVAAGLLAIAGTAKPGSDWRQIIATVPVALDTQTHQGWVNEAKYGLPTLPDGSPVDSSAYLRIAWFKEGLALARENLWGVGFGRNAFGHAVTAKYGEPKGHSHSSFIDLLVGIGIPGIALWLGFLGNLAWSGLSRFRATGSGYPLALFFVVVDFATRMFVDSNVRDHMLQTFMFLAGLLAVLAARQVAADSVPRAR